MRFKKIIVLFIFSFVNTFKISCTDASLISELQEKIKDSAPEWMLQQIYCDLQDISKPKFTKDNLKELLKYGTGQEHALYSIANGKISISDNKIDDFLEDRYNAFNTAIHDLANCVKLPAADFVVCFSDCHLNYNYQVPVFAFCKNVKRDKNIILLPDTQALELAISNMVKKLKEYNFNSPWYNKIKKGFWRGSTTGGQYSINNYFNYPRTKLVKLSRDNQDILEAKFTQIIQTIDSKVANKIIELGYIGQNVSVKEHINYKYQILIDGNSSTWGGSWWRFLCNSVVLKQDSEYILWYYSQLKPYEHYVPFKHDCSNLIEQLNWCIEHDKKAQEIVKNANKFAYNNLTYTDMLVYIYNALMSYIEFQNKI